MKIVINILLFVATYFLLAPSVLYFIRNFTFVIPFSRMMIRYNVYDFPVHKQLIFVDCVSSGIFLLVALVLIVCIFVFFGYIEYITFGLGFLLCFIISAKDMKFSQYNVKRFYKHHYICMDKQNFDRFIQDFISNQE